VIRTILVCVIVAMGAAGTLGIAQAPATADLDAIFRDIGRDRTPGCAVGIARAGVPIATKAYGMANLEHGLALTPQSVFYMASVSKQFLALSVLLLERDGKLRLDDRVRTHVPELPEHTAAITIGQLLHHTGGLRDYLTLFALAGHPPDYVITERAVLRMLARQTRLNFEPGSEHLYSNSGYVLLSIVVHRVSGQPLDTFARARIFGPLGMTSTRFQHDHNDPVPARATGYVRRGDAWAIANSALDVVGDGGLYSSIDDMMRWTAAWARPEFAPLLSRMGTPGTLADGRPIPNGYGMGLSRGTYRGLETIAHGGALVGYRTVLLRLPARDLTIVTLCNTATANTARLAQLIAEGYAGAGMTPAPAEAAPGPQLPASSPVSRDLGLALAGDYYASELDATYRIAVNGDRVTVESGTRAPVALESLGKDRFRAPPSGAELLATRDAGGRVTGLTLNAGRVRGIVFARR
jgi:CubicO group peptidase (beta-lactamase class C family)